MGTRTQLLLLPGLVVLGLFALCGVSSAAEPESLLDRDVTSSRELYATLREANRRGHTVISLRDGVYSLSKTLVISGNFITLRSASGERARVVLTGNGMRATKNVDNLIDVSGRNVSLVGLTLQEAGNHLIQLRGERDADHFRLVNCVLRDSFEQLFKVSATGMGQPSADFGIVRGSLLEYSRELGPNSYIGGIDLHSGREWLIEGNTFRNIASPRDSVAEHAIHIWNKSADNVVRDNLIINADRGIGFGLGRKWERHNRGGEIVGNVIVHLRSTDPFSDVGIGLENSPGTLVRDNFVYLAHDYPNGIEYRFRGTSGVVIRNNVTNKAIRKRDGASAELRGNERAGSASTAFDRLADGGTESRR